MPAQFVCFAAFILALSLRADAQPIIAAFAGADYRFDGDGKRATQAPLGAVAGVAVDRQGQVYFTDPDNHMVMRFTPNGAITVIAGSGLGGDSGDGGQGTFAALANPSGVAVDFAGRVYFCDRGNSNLLKLDADGTIHVIAAGQRYPEGLAIDSAGNAYFSDGYLIRKLSTDGSVTIVAGNGNSGFSGDNGPATDASINQPRGVVVDARGDIYFSDTGNSRIRKISNGIITTVAGNGRTGFSGDGPATVVSLYGPSGLAIDAAGNLYFADSENHRIRRLSTSGNVTTVAGSGTQGYVGDGGSATSAQLNSPTGVAIDLGGNLYIADTGNSRIRRVSSFGAISTAAGNGSFGASGDGGPALNASFRSPVDTAVDGVRNVFALDDQANRVRKIDTAGVISSIAGNGEPGFTGDRGPAVNASLNDPRGIAADRAGNIYIADYRNNRIRKVTPEGTITTFAGGGDSDDEGVPATNVRVYGPSRVAVDANGNVYYADVGIRGSRVRKVGANGIVTTVAGGGTSNAENIPATSAGFGSLMAIATDSTGNLYLSEHGRVRKVSTAGTISTIAGSLGTPTLSCTGEGVPGTSATLYYPMGLAVDQARNVYIADSVCRRIRVISPAGMITTIAGTGDPGYSGDGGPAAAAKFGSPEGIAFDSDGNLYIADSANRRIRRLLTATPQFDVAPRGLTFEASASGAAPPFQSLGLLTQFAGPSFEINLATADGAAWLATNALGGTVPAGLQVYADPTGLDPGSYQGSITVHVAGADPPERTVPVAFNVSRAQPPRLAADPASLSFAFVRGGGTSSRSVTVSNRGGGALPFTASAVTNPPGDWLSISPGAGTVAPSFPVALSVKADASKLEPGTYTAAVVVTPAGGDELRVVVTATVTAGRQTILLSQTGLTFVAVAGGGTVPPQTFGVLNTSQGEMPWTARANTLSGGTGWLSASPNSGSTDASSVSVPLVGVSVRHAGLAPGDYYGQIEVLAPGAENTPQTVGVVLNVLPAGSDPGPLIRPTGLIFVTRSGGNPGSQDVLLSDLGAAAVSFISGRLSDRPGNLFQHQPAEASIAPDRPVRISVQPALVSIDPGVYRGTLTLQFSTGQPQTVSLLFVVAPGAVKAPLLRLAEGCSPTRLIPVFSSLNYGFSIPVSWPTSLEVRVVDDCGAPLADGAVTVTFSNSDPPLALTSLKDGRWTGTWVARDSGKSQVTVTVTASLPGSDLQGSAQLTGGLRAGSSPPVINPGAIVNTASLTRLTPLAPGSLITIFGARLADSEATASGLPLPNLLAGTQVSIAGRSVPLVGVGPDRVDAQIPYDISVNTRHQVLLRRGTVLSAQPEEIVVAAAQPAIFTADRSGSGQGLIYKLGNQGEQTLADSSQPLRTGDRILIECTGLGAVNPPLAAGLAAPPDSQLSAVNPVTLKIGGVDAEITSAVLSPRLPGVYQIRSTIPEGVPAGDSVPFTISATGHTSAPATAAIR